MLVVNWNEMGRTTEKEIEWNEIESDSQSVWYLQRTWITII